MAWVRHVRVDLVPPSASRASGCARLITYPAVGTVRASPLLGGLVDLDVLDDQVAGVETLGVGVGLGVLEETE